MMAGRALWTLLCLSLCQFRICYAVRSAEKDMSLLSFTITPCGATGQEGPTFYQCLDYYRSISSPVADHLVPPIRFYPGLQYFKLPRKGQYSITIAGARGGKGVCAPWVGLAPVFQIDGDYEDRSVFELAIGQQGGDACGSPDWQCLPVNSTIRELVECSDRWRNQPSGVVMGDGGGGGGGGTQVQLVNQLRELNRIFLAAGGGGEGATFPNISSTDNETRANMKNGKNSTSTRTGSGMNEIDTTNLDAGVGGGTFSNNPGTVDGKGFDSVGRLFAIGGTDCSSCCSFEDSHGGFGGGGGGCASGGGGGGRGGGNVRNIANEQHPGEAGTSGPNVGAFSNTGFNDRHGFVVFKHELCGCVHNCTIDSERSVFWCNCPANTFVSPDGFDCYKEETIFFMVDTNASHSVQVQPYGMVTLTQVQMINSTGASVTPFIEQILSLQVNATTEMRQTAGNDTGVETCGLIIVNRQHEIVAAVDFRSSTDGVWKVNSVSDALGVFSYVLDDPVQVLNSSVELHLAFLYHTPNTVCSISAITVNASIEKLPGHTGPVPTSVTNFTNFFKALPTVIPSPSPSSTPEEKPTVPEEDPTVTAIPEYIYFLVATLGAVLLVVCLLLAIIVAVMIIRRRRRRSAILSTLKFRANEDYVTVQPANGQEDTIRDLTDMPQYPRQRPRRPTMKQSFRRRSRSRSMSVMAREELCKSEILYNAYAELNVPNYGVDIDIPSDVDYYTVNQARKVASDTEWHISRDKLSYMRELGEGEFGKVLLMQAKGACGYKGSVPVAVKTLSHEKMKEIDKFMQEVNLMKKFSHPNIVSLIGYCPPEGDGAPMMVLELMKYGDLQSFLQGNIPEPDTIPLISEIEFFHFALDIARALDFLASQQYVHRDIAARNCLVGERLVIKLADFGLAKDIHGKDCYRLGGKAKLPVKWMAPESLLYGEFSQATDVWSFGVVLWEMTSYGSAPLSSLTINEVVNKATLSELQHARPEACPQKLYEIMSNCHKSVAKDRPTFGEIVADLLDYYDEDCRLLERHQLATEGMGQGEDTDHYQKRSPSPDSCNSAA